MKATQTRAVHAARVTAVSALAMLACACAHQAGRDFPRPIESELVFNQTKRADVVARSGPPLSEKSSTQSIRDASGQLRQGEHAIVRYGYVDSTAEGRSGASPQRAAIYHFWNDVLIGYTYTSSFQRDATFFDDANLKQVKRGEKEKAVIGLLGPPSGRLVFPMTESPGDEVMDYYYRAGSGRVSSLRRMRVVLGPDRIVKDYRYDADSTEEPPVSIPYVVTTPVKR